MERFEGWKILGKERLSKVRVDGREEFEVGKIGGTKLWNKEFGRERLMEGRVERRDGS